MLIPFADVVAPSVEFKDEDDRPGSIGGKIVFSWPRGNRPTVDAAKCYFEWNGSRFRQPFWQIARAAGPVQEFSIPVDSPIDFDFIVCSLLEKEREIEPRTRIRLTDDTGKRELVKGERHSPL